MKVVDITQDHNYTRKERRVPIVAQTPNAAINAEFMSLQTKHFIQLYTSTIDIEINRRTIVALFCNLLKK